MNSLAEIWPLSYWTTVMLLTLLPAAVMARANPFLVAVVVANYFGTAGLRLLEDAMLVGFLDAWCAAVIIATRFGDRTNIVAALFLLMPPVYTFGWLLGWDDYATFALVEILGWLQIAVIGNVDRGIGRVLGYMGFRDKRQLPDRDISVRPLGAVSARGVQGADSLVKEDGR